jgi:hypothetical protein
MKSVSCFLDSQNTVFSSVSTFGDFSVQRIVSEETRVREASIYRPKSASPHIQAFLSVDFGLGLESCEEQSRREKSSWGCIPLLV